MKITTIAELAQSLLSRIRLESSTAGQQRQPEESHASNGSESGPVLLVASAGGHLLQLLQLREEWPLAERQWVTFDKTDARSLLIGETVWYAHHPTNRNIPNLLRNMVLAFRLIRRLRPRAIVTTGAGVAVPFCYVGRLFRARVVYIESFARISNPSLTGRLVHPVATSFFVQWPELQKRFRNARYEGPIF
jgi:beta-1,4-N-acetylglucosaminyltransferase